MPRRLLAKHQVDIRNPFNDAIFAQPLDCANIITKMVVDERRKRANPNGKQAEEEQPQIFALLKHPNN